MSVERLPDPGDFRAVCNEVQIDSGLLRGCLGQLRSV